MENPRLDHVFIGVDFSPDSLAAAKLATRLARAQDAAATLFYAAPLFVHTRIPASVAEQISSEARAHCTERLRGLASELEAECTGVDLEVVVATGEPRHEFLCAVEKSGADLVALGTRGRDAQSADWLGGLTSSLLQSSPVPVLAVHEQQQTRFPENGQFQHPMVAIDFSNFALPCARWAAQLSVPKRPIQLVHAVWTVNMEDPRLEEYLGQVRSEEQARLSELANATEVAPTAVHVSIGPNTVREQLLGYVHQSETDLVVLGARGTGEGIGSVATGLARRCEAPTLILPGGALSGA